jgi:hypothetical protein
MGEAGSQLATAGEDLKIWDTASHGLLHQFSPSQAGHVSSNSWSADTSGLASVLKVYLEVQEIAFV